MFGERSLFYQSLLLFSEETMQQLTEATVGVVGIGGVGSIATEMLARLGIGHIRVADPDVYQPYNLNRQVFATIETLGQNKAAAAADKLRLVNPDINAQVFEDGVRLHNVREFCDGCDALVAQSDRESAKVILHRVAKESGIPVICGSRSSIFEHRWKVRARVWNYRDQPDTPCYDETYHPDLVDTTLDQFTPEMLENYDLQFIENRDQDHFKQIAEEHPEFYGTITKDELLQRIATGDNFQNRHVCAVIANTGGCLAAMETLRILLRGPDAPLEINLWEGAEQTEPAAK